MGFDEEYLDDHHECKREIERLQSELAEVQDAFNDVVKRLRVQGECEEEIERLQNQLATERGHRQVDNQESRKEIERLRGITNKLPGAERLTYHCVKAIQRGSIGSRSAIGDAVLDFLDVDNTYEWMAEYEAKQAVQAAEGKP